MNPLQNFVDYESYILIWINVGHSVNVGRRPFRQGSWFYHNMEATGFDQLWRQWRLSTGCPQHAFQWNFPSNSRLQSSPASLVCFFTSCRYTEKTKMASRIAPHRVDSPKSVGDSKGKNKNVPQICQFSSSYHSKVFMAKVPNVWEGDVSIIRLSAWKCMT